MSEFDNIINGVRNGIKVYADIVNDYIVKIGNVSFVIFDKEYCEDRENEICYFKGSDGSFFECLVAEGTFKLIG